MFLIPVTIVSVIIAMFDMYHSELHTPLLFHFPGIPIDNIFFYPINIIAQLVLYFTCSEFLVWSDTIIMICIMYCDAELRTIKNLVSLLEDEEIVQTKSGLLLRGIYEAHRDIDKHARILTESFWHVYFIKLMTIMIYLCSIMFVFQSFDASLIVPFNASVVMITQIFILCYFGQIIRNSSEEVSDALYMTKWYEMIAEDKKHLLMLMINFQNPIKIDSFGFGVISIYTFVQVCLILIYLTEVFVNNWFCFLQILKASVSYATILYTVLM